MFRKFTEINLGTGHDYELEVRKLLIDLGFTAYLTGNDDKGVDIIAQAPTPGNPKFYIQCKYHHKTVALEAIQQVYTGSAIRGNQAHPVVITSSQVTLEARKIALQLGVEIIAYAEWKDLEYGYEYGRVNRKQRFGLMGIIAGLSVKDSNHVIKSSLELCKAKTNPERQDVIEEDIKKAKKKLIKQIYEEAHQCEEEIANLDRQKFQFRQRILKLQEEAYLHSLDYG